MEKKVLLTREELPIADVLHPPPSHAVGAVVSFVGRVRELADGLSVKWVEIEVDDGATLATLEELRRKAIERFSLRDVVIVHRFGRLEVGEGIVLIATFAEHRSAAFEGCSYLIDEIRQAVPIRNAGQVEG
ncbi:MAG: molybdenum cofactor biosynthesis protein MoaE [Methermicoccaceae archaeon]